MPELCVYRHILSQQQAKDRFLLLRSCTVHLQYVPFWALLGLAIMIAGCAVFSIAVCSTC